MKESASVVIFSSSSSSDEEEMKSKEEESDQSSSKRVWEAVCSRVSQWVTYSGLERKVVIRPGQSVVSTLTPSEEGVNLYFTNKCTSLNAVSNSIVSLIACVNHSGCSSNLGIIPFNLCSIGSSSSSMKSFFASRYPIPCWSYNCWIVVHKKGVWERIRERR